MSRGRKMSRFSAGELEIMSMLWARGAVTLAEAHRCFSQFGRPVGYTTMQTRLNRLVEKGAVRRSPRQLRRRLPPWPSKQRSCARKLSTSSRSTVPRYFPSQPRG